MIENSSIPRKPMSVAEAHRSLGRLDRQHEQFYNALTDDFNRQVNQQVAQSVAALVDQFRDTLTFSNGVLEHTKENLQALSKIDTSFEELMAKYGYEKTVAVFVNQFPGQLPLLREELSIINSVLKGEPLQDRPVLRGPDLKVLARQQQITETNLVDMVATAGDLAKRKALVSIAGLNREALANLLAKQLGRTTGDASTLGATAAAMYYRTANARAMAVVEEADQAEGLPPLRYVYEGPSDVLNRPWCRTMLLKTAAGTSWTHAEIDQMDNGQLPDVFTSCGGFNCRHQWRLALEAEQVQTIERKPAAAEQVPARLQVSIKTS